MKHTAQPTPPLSVPDSTPNRRQWLQNLAQAGVLLGLTTMPVLRASASSAFEEGTETFWQTRLPALDGTPQSLDTYRGKPLLVNFWASWCAPCVKELPLLNAFHHQPPSGEWQVLGIAVDTTANIRRFLQRTQVDFPSLVAGSSGIQLSRALGNDSGGLPFTAVFDSSGQLVGHVSGLVKGSQLQQWRNTVR